MRKFNGQMADAQLVDMVDLDKPNHLSPNHLTRKCWKLLFDNVQQLMDVRMQLMTMIKSKHDSDSDVPMFQAQESAVTADPWSNMEELREYDVPYVTRVCMDLDIRAGSWFTVTLDMTEVGNPRPILSDPDIETKANPRVLAFDIECTKAPLKFPNAEVDEIYMISYMVCDGQGPPMGYLITSRSIVSEDVHDFEYTPKPNYPGPFKIFNEKDEVALIRRFLTEFQKYRPQLVATYNGDFFDWPFLSNRAKHHGLDLWTELGITVPIGGEEAAFGRCCIHMDCYCWVQRDSYLPQGSQSLKAVTKYKLGYDPVEVDPEDMLPMAQERPVHMATYSVSDAVATYYLYEKYVHLFIFSLCTLIPMGPADVLRKGSGTCCEALLMVEANSLDIICPNKQVDPLAKFHKGHLLESETYIGGKVECLETGVYRSDVEYDFDLKPAAFQQLIDNIDRDLCFAIEIESGFDRSEVVNYDEVRSQIVESLELLRDRPVRTEKPFIYHLDVGAMYPNIILTNRLQPSAIVNDATCAACDFNQEKNGCKRKMPWLWRGEYSPAGKLEYDRTKDQLSREVMKDGRPFKDLTDREQAGMVSTRLKEYSKNAYRKTKITEEAARNDVICMRENDFYVETVRRFRDRRYDYKKMTKSWKKRIGSATDPSSKKEAEDKALVYDSLQVAHKCILNSFYGYVMRKGARWRSMEMAAITTKNGADIITQARILVEQIGRPLELDTDGIWCILPKSFPDVYTFKTVDGSKLKLEYPCVMLNADVHDNFTNHQYQTLTDKKKGVYESRSECSIFFEVDGPYRCMVLPSSTEEGKLLKKRYAVFNFDGSLAELKGFELKRRGELELIKTFQSQVFERFLDGNSLVECYDSVAEIANHWIDVIDTRGESLDDEELVDLISENRSMSRQLEDYGGQKGTSQTTARRLGEFLGAEIIKDKGLNCKFIIAEQPFGAPVTERAIPTAIWKAEEAVMKHFLRKWLKAPGLDGDGFDMRNILDWDYYRERLGKTIQKIITIPAALQKVPNPVPRVAHPDWLQSKVRQLNDKFQQKTITSMFSVKPKTSKPNEPLLVDMEDISGGTGKSSHVPVVHRTKTRGKRNAPEPHDLEDIAEEARVELNKESFQQWLKQKKSSWRTARRDKKLALGNGNGSGPSRASNGAQRKAIGSMEGFVKEAALSLTQREWQIIEVREMSQHDTGAKAKKAASGEFIVWIMVGGDSLRKVHVTVPRTVYISTMKEITAKSKDFLSFKRVDKYLPHNKKATFLYEVTMPEYVYRKKNWTALLHSVDERRQEDDNLIESVYETGTPLITRALSELGCVSRLQNQSSNTKNGKAHLLSELTRVERPTEGLYLNSKLSYKRSFLYSRTNPTTKTGLVALFSINLGSGSLNSDSEYPDTDVTNPEASMPGSFDISSSCHLWIVKPGSSKGQRNVSLKQCESIFAQLLATIQGTEDLDAEFACISSASACEIKDLKFVDREDMAFAGANEVLSANTKSNTGPTFLLLNSSKPVPQLRRYIPTVNSMPAVSLPFPPGPDHNPNMSTLPALNWEQPAVHLCLEAYVYMSIVSFPKRVASARYGNVPVGNFAYDENFTLYDISFVRTLQKNRALSWASSVSNQPDLGASVSKGTDGTSIYNSSKENDVWADDDELVSPVVRQPGCYRTICVDIDLQDLAVAALSDAISGSAATAAQGSNPASPTSVAAFDSSAGSFNAMKSMEPLGDEMSTSTALHMLRGLVSRWFKDAFNSNITVADSLLHHVYRLVSSPQSLLHDPALHRVVHGQMKMTFMRLLRELQRLGCGIVFASFHKVTVATNKINLADAEEYVKFVLSTVKNQMSEGQENCALSGVSLRPRQFHTHYLFLDEYNSGTLNLDRYDNSAAMDAGEFYIQDENKDTIIFPSVVSGWNIMEYLGNEVAKEYFRVIIGRFSKEVLKKQTDLQSKEDAMPSVFNKQLNEQLVTYKKKMVSKHFAHYLTRAVGEIISDGKDDEVSGLRSKTREPANPVLEFIKSVMVVLELDQEVDAEVHVLRRSLLAQVGVAEYSSLAKWENPCPEFVLPDVFCSECQDSRDINLCYIPPTSEGEEEVKQIHWFCEDCGTEYDVGSIERRLVQHVNQSMMKYQLQDLRCSKTNRVATHSLVPVSDVAAELKLDISQEVTRTEIETLQDLAKHHELDDLLLTTQGMLSSFR